MISHQDVRRTSWEGNRKPVFLNIFFLRSIEHKGINWQAERELNTMCLKCELKITIHFIKPNSGLVTNPPVPLECTLQLSSIELHYWQRLSLFLKRKAQEKKSPALVQVTTLTYTSEMIVGKKRYFKWELFDIHIHTLFLSLQGILYIVTQNSIMKTRCGL